MQHFILDPHFILYGCLCLYDVSGTESDSSLWMLVWFYSVNEGPRSAAKRPQYTSIMNAAACIFRQNGARGLYQGVTPNLWGAGASWGLYFLTYVYYCVLKLFTLLHLYGLVIATLL